MGFLDLSREQVLTYSPKRGGERLRVGFLLVLVLAFVLGCATLKAGREEGKTERPTHVYADFTDIAIPKWLKLDKKRSLVFESGAHRNGYLLYKGRVEPSSLAEYFKTVLTGSGWTLLNNFKYGNYVLNFSKEGRSCIILIEEGLLDTKVHIWVGPIEGPLPPR